MPRPHKVLLVAARSIRASGALRLRIVLAALLGVGLIGALLPLQTSAVPSGVLKCTLPDDFPIPGGWFFQQQKRPSLETYCAGFSVVDDQNAAMWTAYYRLGGAKVLGYPVSRRYIGPGGYIQQAFEFAVLQWRPEENKAVPALIFEQFHDAGLDDKLRFFSIPEPVAPPPGGFGDEVAIRQSWLTEAQIMNRYFTDPRTGQPWAYQEQAWEFYGLPMTPPERVTYAGQEYYPLLAPFVTQRFQRMALRLLLVDDPDVEQNKAGCVATVRAGALARLLQLLPPAAVLEEPIQNTPVVVAEPVPEQFITPATDIPSLINVTFSAINFGANESVVFTLTPLNAASGSGPLKPWEQTLTFTLTTDADGTATAIVPVWTVDYLLQTQGQTSKAVLTQKLSVQATALDQFTVALCQALTSSQSILIAPTPFVPPAGTGTPVGTATPLGGSGAPGPAGTAGPAPGATATPTR